MSSQLQWGYVERVKCKTYMSQRLPREDRDGGQQVKGNNFLPLFSPREAALGYCVQFWCPHIKRDVGEPELPTHRESSGPTGRAGGAGWAQPGWEEVEGDLFAARSYLKGNYKGDGAKLLSAVPGNTTRGSGHRWQLGSFRAHQEAQLHHEDGVSLAQVSTSRL